MHGIPRLVMFMIHFLHKLIAGTKNKSTYFEVNTAVILTILPHEVVLES